MPEHKNHTKTFAELTFAEQAKSINAMLNNVAAAMRLHIRTSQQPARTQNKCLGQIRRMMNRI